ncbi:MAG: STN domain-containing protein, partial [Bacteroidota bacterium]
DFRVTIYDQNFRGEKLAVSTEKIAELVRVALAHVDHCVAANQRPDKLFHAYNLMTPTEDGLSISYLSEMLEGQVAALSLGSLSPNQALEVMDALRASKLYREDQNSYILYPNKDLPGFLEKNNIPADAVAQSALLTTMLKDGDTAIIRQDVNGGYHFNGNFNNAGDLKTELDKIVDGQYGKLVEQDREHVLATFENVFNHKEFTGRSGTFFGYEGLGSIYWHMVSKLVLAVQECCVRAVEEGADTATTDRMIKHYYELVAGIGVHKTPELYGAFPTDPYSHTPAGKGAQQPGMTGQVKEDIMSRIGEFGAIIKGGRLHFRPALLRREAFREEAGTFGYVDVKGQDQQLDTPANTLCYTYCQVPVVYTLGGEAGVTVTLADGSIVSQPSNELALNEDHSQKLFQRTGAIRSITVSLATTDIAS